MYKRVGVGLEVYNDDDLDVSRNPFDIFTSVYLEMQP